MYISGIPTKYNYNNSITPTNNKSLSEHGAYVQKDTVPSNYLHFCGWFKKKKEEKTVAPFVGDEKGMSGSDYTVSFKVADILHRLDDESILVIGQTNGAWVKGQVQALLTKEDSKLKEPKNIKGVYIVNYDK